MKRTRLLAQQLTKINSKAVRKIKKREANWTTSWAIERHLACSIASVIITEEAPQTALKAVTATFRLKIATTMMT